jgi:phosphate transport system substrate-binding protein
MKKSDKKKFKAICHTVREDGAYVEAGENDNLIVQKLNANPDALGIFGFSFLDQNTDKIQGSLSTACSPPSTTLPTANTRCPVRCSSTSKRPTWVIPGIKEYLAEFTSEKAWGRTAT